MATLVGMHGTFPEALNDLLELEYDALEAYEAAVSRLENNTYKNRLADFKNDHQRHIQELTDLLRQHGHSPANGPTGKQWLTKGKVVIADSVIGDKGILSAMKSNELDTNSAYSRMLQREDMWEDAKPLLEKEFADEKRHKEWIEQTLKGIE